MKTGRIAIRHTPLLPALVAFFCAPPAFSWDPYVVDGFNPATVQAPLPAFQGSDTAALPGMEPDAPRGELQRRWYAPVAGRGGRVFVESLPVGTFRPLESAPSPVEWGYKGYSFRPMGPESGLSQAPAGPWRGTVPLSTGVRTEPNRQLPGAGRYSDYGHGSPRFSFRPDRQPVRQRSKGYGSYDPTQPAVGADYPTRFQDSPAAGYYAPQTVDGPQAGRW